MPDQFREDFGAWLNDNWHVYEEFERRALRLRGIGRSHYSARTIFETMRFDSDVGELGGEWKLNNNRVPCLSRLFLMMNPSCNDLFETRSSCVRDDLRVGA